MARTSPSFRFAACDPAAPQTSDATEAPSAWADGAEGVPAPPSTLYEDPEYNANILTLWRGHIAAARDAFKRHDVDGAERELVSLCSVSSSMSQPPLLASVRIRIQKIPPRSPAQSLPHACQGPCHSPGSSSTVFYLCFMFPSPHVSPPVFHVFVCFSFIFVILFLLFAALRNRRSRRRPTSARAPVPLRRAF